MHCCSYIHNDLSSNELNSFNNLDIITPSELQSSERSIQP